MVDVATRSLALRIPVVGNGHLLGDVAMDTGLGSSDDVFDVIVEDLPDQNKAQAR